MIDRSRAVLASIERRHSARVDLPFERGDDLDDGGDEPEPHERVDRELVRPGNVRPPRRVQVEPDVGPGGKDLADALLLRLDPGVRVVKIASLPQLISIRVSKLTVASPAVLAQRLRRLSTEQEILGSVSTREKKRKKEKNTI